MRRAAVLLACGLCAAVFPAAAGAQPPPVPPVVATPPAPGTTTETPPGLDAARQWHIERLSENHWRLTGDVEIEVERGSVWLFAEEVEYFTDTHLITARGNVKF